MKHSLSLMTDAGCVRPRLKASLVSLVLLAMAGCASVPKVEPPDPTQLNAAGHVRHFQGVTPDQVLAAAETVLRRHKPEGRFTHESGTLAMEYQKRFFYVLLGGYEFERWGVVVRALGDVTAASVAMGYATEGYAGTFAGPGVEFPHPTGWYGRAVDIDYGMFWKRMESVLRGEPWPECEQARQEPGYRYYEPLCQRMTINRSNAK